MGVETRLPQGELLSAGSPLPTALKALLRRGQGRPSMSPASGGSCGGGGATCGGGGTGPALLEPPSDTAPGRLKRRGRELGLGSEDEAPGDLEGQGHRGQGRAQASRCRTGFTIKHRRL